jgi:hypothetical protein
VVVAKLPYPLELTKVAVAELLAKYEEMAVAERVMTSVFDLTVYAPSVVISSHLRKFCAGSRT